MIVLVSVKRIFRPLIDPNCDPRIFKYSTMLFFPMFFFGVSGSTFYIIQHITDLMKIMQPFFVIACWLLAFSTWFTFVTEKECVQEIFETLQRNVDASE